MLLRATLGSAAPVPSTIVVTHFDLDHWMGLKAFADSSPNGSENVRLIYPRFPTLLEPIQASLLAYQTLHLTSPERSALDLFRSWENKSAALSRMSACAGDSFNAVGTGWNVLWPPDVLRAGVSKAFARIAKESQDLAKEYEPLGRALDWAYGSGFFTDHGQQANKRLDRAYESLSFEDDDDSQAKDVHPKSHPVGDDGLPSLPPHQDLFDTYGVDDFADASDELRAKLRKNRRDVQRINNELSLVIEETHGRFLNLGDIQKWGLNELIRRGVLQDCYDTILAPHHGTQSPGVRTSHDFPWSRLVIAQNGPGHHPRLRKELSAHTHKLVSTADEGSLSIRGRYHRPVIHCTCRRP